MILQSGQLLRRSACTLQVSKGEVTGFEPCHVGSGVAKSIMKVLISSEMTRLWRFYETSLMSAMRCSSFCNSVFAAEHSSNILHQARYRVRVTMSSLGTQPGLREKMY